MQYFTYIVKKYFKMDIDKISKIKTQWDSILGIIEICVCIFIQPIYR